MSMIQEGTICPQCHRDEKGQWICSSCGRVMKRKLWHMNLDTNAPCDEVPKPEREVTTPLDRAQDAARTAYKPQKRVAPGLGKVNPA